MTSSKALTLRTSMTILLGLALLPSCGADGARAGAASETSGLTCVGDPDQTVTCTDDPNVWLCEGTPKAGWTCHRSAPGDGAWLCAVTGNTVTCTSGGAATSGDGWVCAPVAGGTSCTDGGFVPPGGRLGACQVIAQELVCTVPPSGGGAGGAGGSGGSGGGGGGGDARADLPYAVLLPVGSDFALVDAFLMEGPAPAEIVDVQMDGGSWRLGELRAGARFTITQDDCTHEGNRDQGRDRAFITWRNADGSTETDHLDLRYCKQ